LANPLNFNKNRLKKNILGRFFPFLLKKSYDIMKTRGDVVLIKDIAKYLGLSFNGEEAWGKIKGFDFSIVNAENPWILQQKAVFVFKEPVLPEVFADLKLWARQNKSQ
jgi:hypothetical protein